MKDYAQFCPVAKAGEIVGQRWTLLILRELLCGSHHFNEIHRGVPRMSRSLLTKRLGELEYQGLVTRRCQGATSSRYGLTPAGKEMKPIIMQLGVWGKRWVQKEVSRQDLDAGLLMWDVQRGIRTEALPQKRTVTNFHFPDAPKHQRHFWLVLEPESADLCLTEPGYEEDLFVTANLAAITKVWLGDMTFAQARKNRDIIINGSSELCRQFPRWLGLSPFADIARQSG